MKISAEKCIFASEISAEKCIVKCILYAEKCKITHGKNCITRTCIMEKQRRPKTTDSKWGTTSGKDMGAESAYLHTIIYGLTIGGWSKHLNLRP